MKINARILSLALIFICIVFVPLYFLIRKLSHTDTEFKGNATESKRIIVPATRDGRYIEIGHSPQLNPQSGKDFLFMFWVKLKDFPQEGDRLILASKYSGSPPNVIGYAVGLRRDENVLRPIVFWGPERGVGRWYDFPEITIIPEAWNMFALSFHKNKFLGLQRTQEISGLASEPQVLGGYELQQGVGDFSEAPLLLGASPNRAFKGFIGPLSIVSKRNLNENYKELLTHFTKKPLEPQSIVNDKHVRLFVLSDLIDYSPYHQKVYRRGSW